ncbi:unnamed protein product [Linum tenue]|uniref:Uncharacterized protein n=1 Tax=Linum tenue TaxID=586396 RepID=A0AAV0N4V9_9ROSI|nr:unnamed protein product [Linum tenue]
MGTSVRAVGVSAESMQNEKELSTLIDSLKSDHSYLKKQLASLEVASQPKNDELDRRLELEKIIYAEEKQIDRLVQGSKELKEKVCKYVLLGFLFPIAVSLKSQSLAIQNKIENAGEHYDLGNKMAKPRWLEFSTRLLQDQNGLSLTWDPMIPIGIGEAFPS